MKKQLFTLGLMLAIANNSMAFNERSMFDATNEESKWAFIENKFITQIAEYKQTVYVHTQAVLTGLVAVGAATSLGALYYNGGLDRQVTNPFTLGNISAGAGLGAAILHASSAFECYLSNHANHNAVENFFNNWEQNQFFVPAELQDAFYIIAETIELEGKEIALHNANAIVNDIQFVVMRHFEKRYEKVLQGTAANALADAKTAGEILKNAIESAGKLSGAK